MSEGLKYISDERLAELALQDCSTEEIEQIFSIQNSIALPGMMADPGYAVDDHNRSSKLTGREVYVTGELQAIDCESEIVVVSRANKMTYEGLSLDALDASILMIFREGHGSRYQARLGTIAMWLATPGSEGFYAHIDK